MPHVNNRYGINGGGTYSSPCSKCLYKTPILVSIDKISHCVCPLDNLETFKLAGSSSQAVPGDLQHAAPGNAIEDNSVVQGSSDELQLVGVFVTPDDKEVTGASLGDLAGFIKDPEDLIIAFGLCFFMGHE